MRSHDPAVHRSTPVFACGAARWRCTIEPPTGALDDMVATQETDLGALYGHFIGGQRVRGGGGPDPVRANPAATGEVLRRPPSAGGPAVRGGVQKCAGVG